MGEEALNAITPSGFPLHRLRIKVGCHVLCLRNLDPSAGLMNGTIVRITSVIRYLVNGVICNGTNVGRVVSIHRIECHSELVGGYMVRRQVCLNRVHAVLSIVMLQYPIKVCAAMTINRAQAQTLERVGVYLPEHPFGHGQVYVAFSRPRDPAKLKVL